MLQPLIALFLLAGWLISTFHSPTRPHNFISAQDGKQQKQKTDEPETIRIGTSLVTLSVGVFDKKGQTINNLTPENFAVYEDGQRQTLAFFGREDQPISFGLLLDQSLSMGETSKLQNARAAMLSFLRAGNPQNDAFGLAFNERSRLLFDFTSDYQKVESSLSHIEADGGTALYDAIIQGLEKVERGQHQRRVLVVITDGLDQHSQHTFAELIKRAQQSDAQIYVIGFFSPLENELFSTSGAKVKLADGQEVDNPRFVFKVLAEETGAETFFPRSVPEMERAIATIAASLRRQYTLAYYPANQNDDGRYHQLKVSLSGPHSSDWQVKTRQGYSISESSVAKAETEAATSKDAKPRASESISIESRVSATPLTTVAPKLYRETFDDPNSGWPNTAQSFYKKGQYHVLGHQTVPATDYEYTDFEASVSVGLLRGTDDAGRTSMVFTEDRGLSSVGFSFRIGSGGYYIFAITPTPSGQFGFYKLVKVVGGEQTELIAWKRDNSIRIVNQLMVRCRGPQIELYINGLRVDASKDTAHTQGRLALVLSDGHAAFDNLVIKKLEK